MAEDYCAMAEIEGRLELSEGDPIPPSGAGQLLALVDSLSNGTLNDGQRETVQSLRTAILSLAQQETEVSAVEEQNSSALETV